MSKLAPPLAKLTQSARALRGQVMSARQWLMGPPQTSVLADAIPFQDPIDEICEEAAPPFMRSIFYVVLGLFVITILVASLVKVEVVVTGTGRLATETPPIMLQPLDRAIVREILVKSGDEVKKGQVLATLDPTFTQADLESLSVKQRSLLAQIRRLEAELNGTEPDFGEAPSVDDQLQQSLFRQRQSQYTAQLRFYEEEIQRRRANIRSTEDDRKALAQQLEIAREVEKMRGAMLEKQSGSRLNYLEAQSVRMRVEQGYQDAGNTLVELKHDLESKEAELQSFIDQWRQQTLEALVAVRTEAAVVGEGLSKATLMNDLVVVTAPEDGVVLDVAKRSVGSVLNPAESLVTMIKTNAKMIGEITINSSDIGYVKSGADVVIKVDAFNYQRHGFLKGELISVSEESFPAGGGPNTANAVLPQPSRTGSGAFHRGLVRLTHTELENLPEGSKLIPGMTMTAEIKVGSRSIMSFFLSPITRGLGESLREP
ncbi:MAG: HlyD family type I secretion periplasmic adaptor subunit [Rhodospirillaceae bacterium]|nr:HlyD family type I secretion periplasmic adaptor subunit [Rhodospirillaceae bacterium]